jgi:hypothetical protein
MAFLYKHRIWFILGTLLLVYVFMDRLLRYVVW